MSNDAPDRVPVPAPPAETLRQIAENIGYDRGRRRWSDDGSGTGEVNIDHEKLTLLILGAMWQAWRVELSPAPPTVRLIEVEEGLALRLEVDLRLSGRGEFTLRHHHADMLVHDGKPPFDALLATLEMAERAAERAAPSPATSETKEKDMDTRRDKLPGSARQPAASTERR